MCSHDSVAKKAIPLGSLRWMAGLIALVFLIGGCGRINAPQAARDTKAGEVEQDMDYAAICKVLQQFFDEHERDPRAVALKDFGNIRASTDGRRVKLEEGLWALGSWMLRGNSDECTAYLVKGTLTGSGDLSLEVKLIRKGDSYVVQDWITTEEY